MISSLAVKNIQSHITDALSKGAVDVTPSNPTFQNLPAEGNYLAPTVLINATHDMQVMKHETFGPVLPIMKVSSDEEAVDLMNDSDYGLTASIWTKDIKRGEELIDDVEAGTVYLNRCDYPSPVCLGNPSARNVCANILGTGSGVDRMEEFGSGVHAGP